jgi:hypothetical protein
MGASGVAFAAEDATASSGKGRSVPRLATIVAAGELCREVCREAGVVSIATGEDNFVSGNGTEL